MDDQKVLSEARKTIEHIKATQKSLDEYLSRLEVVVTALENELRVDQKISESDIEEINKFLDVKDIELEKKKPKQKRKIKFNVSLFLGVILLIFTLSLQYISLQKSFTLQDKTYFIYKQVNMEPSIKSNSIVSVNSDDYTTFDKIAYYTKHNIIRIKEVDKVEGETITLVSSESAVKSYEDIDKSAVIGKVEKSNHKYGNILVLLIKYLLVFYLITIILFIVGVLFN